MLREYVKIPNTDMVQKSNMDMHFQNSVIELNPPLLFFVEAVLERCWCNFMVILESVASVVVALRYTKRCLPSLI